METSLPAPKGDIHMEFLKKALIAVLVVALIASVGKYMYLQKELKAAQEVLLSKDDVNGKVLNFTKLFIQKVLKARGEISFETRLQLENAVRDLNDSTVLASWQKFVDSGTELEAQNAVKDLLDVLVSKIRA